MLVLVSVTDARILSKCFDKVLHGGLIFKLEIMGVKVPVLC